MIYLNKDIRKTLKELDARDFFINYSDRPSYQEIPLLTADGIVIPFNGLKETLSNKDHVNNVPIIAGSNKDEVKLWLASAEYFVGLEYSFFWFIIRCSKSSIKR